MAQAIQDRIEKSTGAIVIGEYDDVAELAEHANELAEDGYYPIAVTNQPQRAGFWRIVLLWFFALLWTPKPHLIVTYRREE